MGLIRTEMVANESQAPQSRTHRRQQVASITVLLVQNWALLGQTPGHGRGCEGEAYESAAARGSTSEALKFDKRLRLSPQQCIRLG